MQLVVKEHENNLDLVLNSSQSAFLRGLQKLINVLKGAEWYKLPAASDEPNLFNRDLPFGVCSGYSYVAPMAELNKNVLGGRAWQTSYHNRFDRLWRQICRIDTVEVEKLSEWIKARQADVKHWVLFAEHILDYHYHSLHQPLQNHASYFASKNGATQEFTLTVNLSIAETEKDLSYNVLAEFLSDTFLQNNLFTMDKVLRISDGRHGISISHNQENGSFVLHDANGSRSGITDVSELAQRIIASLDFHGLQARYIALNFNLLSFNPNDELFDDILKNLQVIDGQVPSVNPNEDPQHKPIHQLLIEFHDHSRAGLISDLLHFKFDLLDAALRRKMQEYLLRFPDQINIIERYRENINMPSCSGHSWLHLQMMTGELYAMHALIERGALPNEGIDPTKKMFEVSASFLNEKIDDSEAKLTKQQYMKGGVKNNQWDRIDDHAETKITKLELYLSYPIHYAVVSNNLYALKVLVKAGADVNRTTQRGETPLALARAQRFQHIEQFLLEHGALEQVENNFPRERKTGLEDILRVDMDNDFKVFSLARSASYWQPSKNAVLLDQLAKSTMSPPDYYPPNNNNQ